MSRLTLSLSPAQRSELEFIRDRERRAYLRECASALLKVASGQSARQVALFGLLRPRKPETVYRWIAKYGHDGPPGLVHKPRGHRGFSPH